MQRVAKAWILERDDVPNPTASSSRSLPTAHVASHGHDVGAAALDASEEETRAGDGSDGHDPGPTRSRSYTPDRFQLEGALDRFRNLLANPISEPTTHLDADTWSLADSLVDDDDMGTGEAPMNPLTTVSVDPGVASVASVAPVPVVTAKAKAAPHAKRAPRPRRLTINSVPLPPHVPLPIDPVPMPKAKAAQKPRLGWVGTN